MTRTQLAAAAAAVLLLAGCGGGDDSKAASTPSPTPSATPSPLTEAELKAALITQADVPPGYTLDTSAEEDDEPKSKASTPECQAKYDLLDEAQDTSDSEVEVSFTNEDKGVDLSQSWDTGQSVPELSEELATFRSLITDCPKVQLISTDGTPPIDVTLSSFPLTSVGDESLGMLANGNVEGTPISFAFAFVRVGSSAQMVSHGGVGSADLALVEKITKLGVERLPARK